MKVLVTGGTSGLGLAMALRVMNCTLGVKREAGHIGQRARRHQASPLIVGTARGGAAETTAARPPRTRPV